MVIVLVSHHKAINQMIKLKYKNMEGSKKKRAQDYVEEPSYCCTLMLNLEEAIVSCKVIDKKKNDKTPGFAVSECTVLFK